MIGVFDSGIGGLTVVRELEKALPGYPLLYLGDTARTPYGSKSAETIIRYAIEDASFLVERGCRLIVVACNTASSVAMPELKRKFPDQPIFDVIEPAVEEAKRMTKGRIGVVGTRATIQSGIYQSKLKDNQAKVQVFTQACPLLVPLVEENWLDKPVTKLVLRGYVSGLKQQQIDTLILGCTHYPLLRPLFQAKIGKRARVVDPARATAEQVRGYLNDNPGLASELKTGQSTFYLTDLTEQAHSLASRWLGRPVKFEKAVLG